MKQISPLFFILTLVAPVVSGGTVYKSVDDSGHVTYADQPLADASRVEIIELQTGREPENAGQLAHRRIEQMAAVTERLQRDRQARQSARQSVGEPLYPYPIVERTVVEEHRYLRYPRHLTRFHRFPDIRRRHFRDRGQHDLVDLSAPPPRGVLLTPRSRLLTPR